MVTGVIAGGGGISSSRTYATMLSETLGGVNPMSMNQLDLVPRASYSKLVTGVKETRSPINCVELKNGASPKKEKVGLVRRPVQGGNASMRKTLRVL
jgi:hypothetical protein